MNQVVLIGRLTADPELKFVPSSGKAVANFRLAVNRAFSRENKADFFRVVVWGKQAESVSKYLSKGSQCAVNGSIQINQFQDKDGVTRYFTDIVANNVQFLGSPSGQKNTSDSGYNQDEENTEENYPLVEDDELPF